MFLQNAYYHQNNEQYNNQNPCKYAIAVSSFRLLYHRIGMLWIGIFRSFVLCGIACAVKKYAGKVRVRNVLNDRLNRSSTFRCH